MRIGKLFHLTSLVDDLSAAELFFNSVFAPLCSMRNYSEHWHRHAAIYIIAETAIEPMEVLPPAEGAEPTSWFRYMRRFGPHIHNMAFYVDDRAELARRFAQAGVRTTDGGNPSTLFAHPKDTPGMLEFLETGGRQPADPRLSAHWAGLRDDFWPNGHPLGLERMSHLTVVVHDLASAGRFYLDVLDGRPLAEQPSSVADADARFVLVGEDTVIELAQPRDRSSVLAHELDTVGQCVTTVTFKVRDIDRAAQHLHRQLAPVVSVDDHRIVLDRACTWGAEYRFTDLDLAGDPRTGPWA